MATTPRSVSIKSNLSLASKDRQISSSQGSLRATAGISTVAAMATTTATATIEQQSAVAHSTAAVVTDNQTLDNPSPWRPKLRPVSKQTALSSSSSSSSSSPPTTITSPKFELRSTTVLLNSDPLRSDNSQPNASNETGGNSKGGGAPAEGSSKFQLPKLRPVQQRQESLHRIASATAETAQPDTQPAVVLKTASNRKSLTDQAVEQPAVEPSVFQRPRLRSVQQQPSNDTQHAEPTVKAEDGVKATELVSQREAVAVAVVVPAQPSEITGAVKQHEQVLTAELAPAQEQLNAKASTATPAEIAIVADAEVEYSPEIPIELKPLESTAVIIPKFSLEVSPATADQSTNQDPSSNQHDQASISSDGEDVGVESSETLGTRHVNDLKRILRLDYSRQVTSDEQKAAYRSFLTGFNAHYRNIQNYALNWSLSQPDAELLDLLFASVSDLTRLHESTDAILQTHTIVSRGSKRVNGGVERRVEVLIRLIQKLHDQLENNKNLSPPPQPFTSAIIRETVKALINYAEPNSRTLMDTDLIETLCTIIKNGTATGPRQPLGDDESTAESTNASVPVKDSQLLVNCVWLIQNMCGSETARQQVWEKARQTLLDLLSRSSNDSTMCERLYWVFGNVCMDEKLRAPFADSIAIASVKSVLTTHAEKERVVEAVVWFLHNAASNDDNKKALQLQDLGSIILNCARKFISGSPNIKVWAESAINALRPPASPTAEGNPTAQHHHPAGKNIMERYYNRVEHSGPLSVLSYSFFWKRVSKKFAILQHGMLVLFKNEHENEADEFVDLRKVQDVIWAQGSTEIEIVTETNRMHFAATDSPSARQWVTSIRQFWRDTVNPLTEYPKSFMYNSGPAFGLISLSALMSATESIAKEDVERVAVMHALHEIYSNPYFICVPFRCQKAFPAVSVSDYFAVIFAKKICKLFMASELSSCKSTEDGDEDFYVIDQIKTAVSRLIDQSIVKEMLAFDDPSTFSPPPNVSTRYEFCAKQGLRPGMEDRHVHIPYMDLLLDRENYSENPISYYAVYDGHGGTNVAEYVESHLHFNILQHVLFNSEPEKAIAESFMNTQESLKKHADRLLQSNTAGSTAVVIIIKGKQMFIAWAGDSLASLFMSDGTIHELIDPHKPGKPSEKERIEKLGGYVREEAGGVLRVNSAVAVSRAFGNIRHKVIIPEADVRVRELTGQEAFLVLACDGLWDVMTPQEVRQFVGIYFTRNGRRLKGISEALVDEALRRGSTDNVSVVFVQFNGWNMPKT